MRKLFLSFTSTLGLIARGEVSESDLMSGIFYFGCARVHAYTPWEASHGMNELEWCFKHPVTGEYDGDRAAIGHALLLKALDEAEKDGRAAWRTSSGDRSYKALESMLLRNGHGSMRKHIQAREWEQSLSQHAVREIASHIGVEVPGRL